MFVALLVFLLSGPGEPMVIGVLGEFDSPAACMKVLRSMEVPDEQRAKLGCIEVRRGA